MMTSFDVRNLRDYNLDFLWETSVGHFDKNDEEIPYSFSSGETIFHAYDIINEKKIRKISFLISHEEHPYAVTVKDVSDDPSSLRSAQTIRTLQEGKNFFVREMTGKNYMLMDFFSMDATSFVEKKNPELVTRVGLCNFVINALSYLLRLDYCYVDIKPQQMLMRKLYTRSDGYYHTVTTHDVEYEVAIGDLDFDVCEQPVERFTRTFLIPPYFGDYDTPGMKTKKTVQWATSITCAYLLGYNVDFFYGINSKTEVDIRNQVEALKLWLSSESGLGAYPDLLVLILAGLEQPYAFQMA